MFINNKTASILYKFALLAVCGVGLGFVLFSSGAQPATLLTYFTILSNLLVFGFYLISIIVMLFRRNDLRCSVGGQFKGGVLMSIMLTCIVFHIMLRPLYFTMDGSGFWSVGNFFPHYATPIMVLLDWVLFDRKGRYKWSGCFVFAAVPLAYLVFSFLRAEFGPAIYSGGRYPYPFMDIDAQGIPAVAATIGIMFVAFIAASLLFIGIDKLLGEAAHKRAAVK